MSSRKPTAFTELPIVDVSPLYSENADEWQIAATKLGQAAEETGFLYVTGHRVSLSLRQSLLAQTKRFFALPDEQKMDIYIGKSSSHRGYVPEGEEVMADGKRDRKEALDLGYEVSADHPLVVAGTPMIGPNQWPQLEGFRPAIEAYYNAVFDLGRHLLRGFALALGQPAAFFDKYVDLPAEPASPASLSIQCRRCRCAGHWSAHRL